MCAPHWWNPHGSQGTRQSVSSSWSTSWAKSRVDRKPGGAVGRELVCVTVFPTSALDTPRLFSTAARVILLKHSNYNTPVQIPLIPYHLSYSSREVPEFQSTIFIFNFIFCYSPLHSFPASLGLFAVAHKQKTHFHLTLAWALLSAWNIVFSNVHWVPPPPLPSRIAQIPSSQSFPDHLFKIAIAPFPLCALSSFLLYFSLECSHCYIRYLCKVVNVSFFQLVCMFYENSCVCVCFNLFCSLL